MRGKLPRLLSCLLTLCLLLLSLSALTALTRSKDSVARFQPFFDQEEDFDVLFLGASHTIDGVFPLELWNDHGMVSYNLGGFSSRLPTTYWLMENTLDYTSPKLIVLDCFYLSYPAKTSDSYSTVHLSMDPFPLSPTKVRAVFDLLDDPVVDEMIESGAIEVAEQRSHLGLLWDFSVYHARWNELSYNDFQVYVPPCKGDQPCLGVAVPDAFVRLEGDQRLEEDTVGVEYLRRIIEECRERDIEILLTYLPYPAEAEGQMEANRVYEIAAEYGVNYINFLDMDLVDFDTDCFDSNSHLNVSGARKVTDYLGEYIKAHYQIPDRREDPAYSGWFEDYKDYRRLMEEYLAAQSDRDTYLMMLADKHLDTVIEVNDPTLWSDGRFVSLVKNLGVDLSEVSEATNYLVIGRGGAQAQALSLDPSEDARADTPLGLLQIAHNPEGGYTVSLDGAPCLLPETQGGLRIYTRDSDDLHQFGQAVF